MLCFPNFKIYFNAVLRFCGIQAPGICQTGMASTAMLSRSTQLRALLGTVFRRQLSNIKLTVIKVQHLTVLKLLT